MDVADYFTLLAVQALPYQAVTGEARHDHTKRLETSRRIALQAVKNYCSRRNETGTKGRKYLAETSPKINTSSKLLITKLAASSAKAIPASPTTAKTGTEGEKQPPDGAAQNFEGVDSPSEAGGAFHLEGSSQGVAAQQAT